MAVNYIETASTDPCYNLAFEEHILESQRRGDWLMLWQNANTVVVGLNQNTAQEINADFIARHGVTVVRRMTGGGAVYHDLGNLNYSFITDVGDAESLSIARFTAPVCRALESMGVHAETSGRNDITVGGRKVSGVAQRIVRGRILHHGTLLFDSDAAMVAGALRADPSKFASKSAKSVRSRIGNIREALPRDMTLEDFRARLLEQLSADGLARRRLGADELAAIARTADSKYRSWDWTYGRSPKYDYENSDRFPGGTLWVKISASGGLITDAAFQGDFMALRDNRPAVSALIGVPADAAAVAAALAPLDLASMFGGITLQDILSVMFQTAPPPSGGAQTRDPAGSGQGQK